MDKLTIHISIPVDEDGFIEMECDFCKNRFMLHKDVYESEENINFYCPICGLPNKINTFYCSEVIEKVRQITINTANSEIERVLGKSIKAFNRVGCAKMSLNMPRKEFEKELYTPSANYVAVHKRCCDLDVKVLDIDKEIGVYCPVCGRME